MVLSSPVAFIIFNRPDLTNIIFDAIRQAQPKKLLVVADGARFPEEAEKCNQARQIIEKVDWNCEVLTNFSDINMGCRLRISSGLDWVFSQVEEAIILEDDCLPSPSFFQFCQELLEKYREDERIMHIGASNFQNGQSRTEYSYYFSKYVHVWGWATWRRAWKLYDSTMKTWAEFRDCGMMQSISRDKYEETYWTNIFNLMSSKNSIDSWAYIWVYTCWSQNGLAICPDSNMIANLGFREDATHTKNQSQNTYLASTDIWNINHPPFIVINIEADTYTFDYVFNGQYLREQDTFKFKFRQKLQMVKHILKKLFF